MVELTNKIVNVRKEHRCVWCGEKIGIKDRAVYRAYVLDGFQTDYMHPECHEAMTDSDWRSLDPCGDGWEAGQFKRGMRAEECEPGYED